MMFTAYPYPDSGFSSPLSGLPSCSAFDPEQMSSLSKMTSPLRRPSSSRIRRRLSYESIDTPATKDAATQTEPELTDADRANCRRIARKLREMCDEFDREYFQPAQSQIAPVSSATPSSSYPSRALDFLRSFF